MAAPESTKFQVNFKSPDGTLINLYAANKEELEALLTAAQDFSALIASVSQSFSGAAPAAPVHTNPTPRQFAKTFAPETPVPTDGHVCRHGAMSYREGTGAKGPWKGWMCAAPKGATDKCPTIWVR
jgi:hypothetical protein